MAFVVCLALALLIQTVSAFCPDGFVTHQGVCYKEFDIRATWDEAVTYCQAYGGELATVHDNSEQLFVAGLLQRLVQSGFHSNVFWLGGTDAGQEMSWVWGSTGQPLSFKNWNAGEPNNAGSGENCLSMAFADNLQWNDMPCGNKYSFICEVREGMSVIG